MKNDAEVIMKKGLYPTIAGTLLACLFLSMVFEDQINSAGRLLGVVLIVIVALIAYGAVLLALWDNEVIGKKNKR